MHEAHQPERASEMNRTEARVRRALLSIISIIALFVAVPMALLRVTRFRFDSANPLTELAPPWKWTPKEVGDALSEPLRDDAVVNVLIRASLTVVWMAIAVIALSVIVEVVHMIRHAGLPSPRVRGFSWAQRPGRWIAVGIVTLLPLNAFGTPASATTADSPAALSQQWAQSPDRLEPVMTEAPSTHHAPPPSTPTPTSATVDAEVTATPMSTYTVERGDSVFGIAAALTGGDQERTIELADRILDLNLHNVMSDGERFTNPALIQPGWRLTLPAEASMPADAAAPRDASAGDAAVDSQSHITHVVVDGDTLSGIAEQHLGDADEWPAIWAENAHDTMADGRSFDDPNLIVPGWEVDVPTPTEADPPVLTAPAEKTTVQQDTADEPTQPSAPEPAGDDSSHLDATVSPTETTSVDDAPTPPRGMPTTVVDIDATVPRDSVPVVVDPGNVSEITPGDAPAPQAPSPIRLEHGALLAAGLLTLVGVRRRRALRAALPHARVPTPPPEVAATERRLRFVDAGERASRVDVAIRAAAHRVADVCQVGSVRIAKDGEVIVRFTGAADLEAPWVASDDDPATWTLPASVPIELLAEDSRKVGQPCLALVTIGLDEDGRDVLIDLEAAGVTAVEGIPDQADQIVRAVGSGLAASLTSEVVHLVVAGLGAECLFDHPNARQLESVGEALDAALTLVGSTSANDRTSFDLRSRRTGGEMWEPAVLLFDTNDDAADRLAFDRLPWPGHGIATVLATPTVGMTNPAIGARLTAHQDGWMLSAFGQSLRIAPIGVSAADVAEVARVLAEADCPIEPAQAESVIHEPTAAAAEPFEPHAHDVVVRLMGGVEITDRSGNVGAFERSKTVELIAWLATHRDRATRTAARTALWELDVRDATFANVVSEARRGLGRLVPPPDGEEWLARTLNESLPLHELVLTDADLIEQRVEQARLAAPSHAIEVLRPAVELIRDMPFAGTSYLWPDADGLTSNLVLLATTAAAELAGHALSVGDTDLVFWATTHGLKVLPGHEELIGLRMRAHARAGDLSGVRQEWESYERVIMADAWSDGEPAPKLLDLRRQLLSPNTT